MNPDRAARLAAMTSNAATLDVERQGRLNRLLAEETATLEKEEAERAKNARGGDTKGRFLASQQKRVLDTELGDRLSRGRMGLVRGD